MNQKLAVIFLSSTLMLTAGLNGMDVVEYRSPDYTPALDVAIVGSFGGAGAIVGGAVGAALGAVGGPAGAVLGAKLGAAVGGVGAGGKVAKMGFDEYADKQKAIKANELPIRIIINHSKPNPSKAFYDAYLQFKAGKQALVIARAPFNLEKEQDSLESVITSQCLPLRQALGIAIDNESGNYVTLTNQTLNHDLASAIANPSGPHAVGIKMYMNHLAAFPSALGALKKLAVLSSAPIEDSRFEDTLRNFMAHAIWTSILANHHPLREKLEKANTDLAEANAYSSRLANYWSQEVVRRGQLEREKDTEFAKNRRLEVDLQVKNSLVNTYKGISDILYSSNGKT